MKVVKEAIYMSILGTSICLTACGRNNNQSEGAADPVENNMEQSRQEAIETETDSLVSPDTVMPAP